MNYNESALFRCLEAKNTEYAGHLVTLHERISTWLNYIPNTFPHYTSHTIDHSDEIVFQLSDMLFHDSEPEKICLSLSAVEMYILCASAFLHDVGMVVSDEEKKKILASDDWIKWTTEEGGKKRWEEIQAFEKAKPDSDESKFVVNLQIRHLIAEFIRRSHHNRSRRLIIECAGELGDFDFGDSMLRNTIADVCASHGLRGHELEDSERFPDRRQIRHEPVNVRLMALLLRIGDLLDLRKDRACPLLLNAACPLPSESLAHWSQYKCISHIAVAPDSVEIRAECSTHDEHRVLQDWCKWLESEVHNAEALIPKCRRHQGWRPPNVILSGDKPTVIIRPKETASYLPTKWVFELDSEAVFDRLIRDVYDTDLAFIREMIQNALDATRCKMYADIVDSNQEPPEYPTQVEEEIRQRYPVRITLKEIQIRNDLSGEDESRQVLIVEDMGIGMDQEIIERYLLQVGRSYYQSDEFRRNYRFVPTSRFGIGFLSVFAVSERVEVDTFKPNSSLENKKTKMTLTGPRNYLLTEKGTKTVSGTSVSVILRKDMEAEEFMDAVSNWCKRVEFPIIVNKNGNETTILAEKPENFISEVQDVTTKGAKYVVKCFPVDVPGVEGELYVIAHEHENREDWSAWGKNRSEYLSKHPNAIPVHTPGNLLCFQGINISSTKGRSEFRPDTFPHAHLDLRGPQFDITSARNSLRTRGPWTAWWDSIEGTNRQWERIITEHLAKTKHLDENELWIYKQDLFYEFDFLESFWKREQNTLRVFRNGQACFVSLNDILDEPCISIYAKPKKSSNPPAPTDDLAIQPQDFDKISWRCSHFLLEERNITDVLFVTPELIRVIWSLIPSQNTWFKPGNEHDLYLARFQGAKAIGFYYSPAAWNDITILNENSEFSKWVLSVLSACVDETSIPNTTQGRTLLEHVKGAISYPSYSLEDANEYLSKWNEIEGLPDNLKYTLQPLKLDDFIRFE